MLEAKAHDHLRAVRMLVLATVFWGISFPVVRAMHLLQAQLLPDANSWFTSGAGMVVRFLAAGLAMTFMFRRALRSMTRLEWRQGALLGFFCGTGSLLQMDGMAYTDASTSAFLTQSYCVMVPALVCLRDRALPKPKLVVCCLLMFAGIAILTPNFDIRGFRLGRGELETLLGALLFCGQILCLENPRYQANRPENFSVVMLWVIFAVSLVPALWHTKRLADWGIFTGSLGMMGLVLVLACFCTVAAYLLMNRYQPKVTSTEATLIYGCEPVCASLFALFVPGLITLLIGVQYANERLTWNLVVGGGVICLANLILQWGWIGRRPKAEIQKAPSLSA